MDVPIGVTLPERQTVTTLSIDLFAEVDLAECGQSDRVEAVVDYAAVVESLRESAAAYGTDGVLTLEFLAGKMAAALKEKFPLAKGRLVLHKNNHYTEGLAKDVAIGLSWG